MTNQKSRGRSLGSATTCHVDRDGVIVKTNSHFDNGSPQQFIGVQLSDYLEEPSRSEYLALLARALEHGEVSSYRNTVKSQSGELSCWEVRISPWREDGRIIGAVMVGNQILS